MKEIRRFLCELAMNNEREWFNANKGWYLECKERFDEFTEQLIAGIREFDPHIGALTPKDCTYRIYRDTRFTNDKTPYKVHFGAYIVPGGKKSGYSGYYFQIGANEKGFPGGNMLAVGDYICEPRVLQILREDIVNDDERQFLNAIEHAKGFYVDFDGAYKRVPSGYPADQEYSQYLRLRQFCLMKEPGFKYMEAPRLLERVLADFSLTTPFLNFINRAIAYSKDQEW